MRWEHWFYTVPLRLRSIFRRAEVDRELEAELRLHLERRIEQDVAAGRTLEEARRSALQVMGGIEQRKEECRDARRVAMVDSAIRDFRYAFRVLRKKPALFLIATATLGLGIGIATTLFSVVESQLWRPLPFPNSERLVAIWKHNLQHEWKRDIVSPYDFAEWRARARTFERLAAVRWPDQRNFSAEGITERPQVGTISAGFLETLGAMPVVGRTFETVDEQQGHGREAILSSTFARRVFGSVESSLRKAVKLDGETFTVIGVMPDGFQLEFMRTPDVFIPLQIERSQYDSSRHAAVEVIGRLGSGIGVNQAQQDLGVVAQQIAMEHPQTNRGWTVYIEGLRGSAVWPYRTSLLLYFGFSIFVLAIACANVAGLQLVRAAERQNEFAIREALGAGRPALMRQALSESCLIAVAGGALGAALAQAGMRAIRSLPLDRMFPRPNEVSMNLWAIAFALGISLISTLAFGLIPGFSIAKANVDAALRESARTVSGSIATKRRIGMLVTAEVALAFISLFGAGLFVSSNREIQHVSLGFNPRRIVTIHIPLSGGKYSDHRLATAFYQRVSSQLSATPGVREFAISNSLPLHDAGNVMFTRADRPQSEPGDQRSSLSRIVTPAYFHLFGIPVLRGRGFTDHDSFSTSRVVIINQNLARHYFAGENPVGKEVIVLAGGDSSAPIGRVQIVGVAANSKEVGPNEVDFDDIYFPFAQSFPESAFVLFKTSVPALVAPTLRQKIRRLDREEFVAPAISMESYVARALHGDRIKLLFVATFAALAMLLTGIGIYGAISFAVAQRTREFGLRIALGAAPRHVLQVALHDALRFVMLGSGIGLATAFVLGEIFRNALYLVPHEHEGMLYKVGIHDPLSFICAAALLFTLGVMAGLVPGRKAAAVNPCDALRLQ